MLSSFRKLIWNLSSQTEHFKGKERIVALLSRPGALSQIAIKRQGVNWYLQGHDLNEFAIAVRKNHSSLLSQSLNEEITRNMIVILFSLPFVF
jgi:23S rRNA U2552 (ribose-2'-O)-methylase RlmE/FtsJ